MRKRIFLHRAFAISLIIFFFLGGGSVCVSTIPPGGASSSDFYFFNPDSPQSNLGRLKQEFDTYLASNSLTITFQPFTHFVDFHRLNSENPPSFIIVPEWYYRRYGRQLGLRPLLVPVRNGNTSYKKILLAGQGPGFVFKDSEIISFAMTTMGPDNEDSVIRSLIADELVSSQQINIIKVPKDIDAIFALVLGQVKMALVAQDNLQAISRVNPRITGAVRKLEKSITVPMPVLCYLEGRAAASDVQRITETFRRMAAEQPRNKIMEMLQIDEWQKFTE